MSFWDSVTAVATSLGEYFGLKKQEDNPETIRLKQIREIDKSIDENIELIKKLSLEKVTPENETEQAVKIGNCTLSIIGLRQSRASLER